MKTHHWVPALLLALSLQVTAPADDWPQFRGPGRDGVWHESGIIEKFDGPEIKVRWRAEIAGGYAGPTVADGRVYVADRVSEPEQVERVHCFRFGDGEKLWSYTYPCDYAKVSYRAGPRASISLDEGRAYALGTMGHLHCFDAATGRVLWKKDPAADFNARVPTWGVAAAPLIEGELVILQIGGRDGACLVALDKKTGERRWAALDDAASYAAPIVIDQAGRRVVVCMTATRVVGLDATDGRLYWHHEVGFDRWPIAIASPVWREDRLFVSVADQGSVMLRLAADRPEAELLWWRRGSKTNKSEGLHALMCTPQLADSHVYGFGAEGVLRCLNADTGDRVWADQTATTQARWGTGHLVRNGRNVWIFNDRGELVISRLSPEGFREISRAKLIEPTLLQLRRRDGVTWSPPAFAYQHVFVRSDKELVCASLAADE